MKSQLLCILCLFCINVSAAPYEKLISDIKNRQLSLETISALTNLEAAHYAVGYGLCMANGRAHCETDGSVGYGVCMVADRVSCEMKGSIGYGLCMAAGRTSCDVNGTIGYGMCMSGGRVNCEN